MKNDRAKTITSLRDLRFHSKNPNRGTKAGAAFVERSLKDYGAGRSILVDRKGEIISGNQTTKAALKLGHKKIRVVQTTGDELVVVQRTDLDLDSKPARELAVADNRGGELGMNWDLDALTSLDLNLPDFFDTKALKGMGFEFPELEAPEPQLDKAAELQKKWQTARGQIWEIGKHRLMCGDSTDGDDVSVLMKGAKAALLCTDPPYGVRLRLEDNHEASNSAKGIAKQYRHFESIDGDELEGESLQAFLEKCFTLALSNLKDNAAWYLWHAQLSQGFFAAAAAAQLLIHRQIIWVKPHFVFGRGDYHWQHELCFYGWVKGNRPPFYGQKNQSSVWHLAEGGGAIRKDQNHPTQKPVELFAIPLRNHTMPDEICYEPFAGSGSQLCAAQLLDRMCYGMEIEPKYVAVCLERMHDMGLSPKLATA
jgi:DNA modification methylase